MFLTLDGNFSSPDYAFYSYTDTSNVQHGSIPVGPYITYLNGDGFNNTLAYTFCYDFNSPTDVGTAYPGILEVRTDTASLEATYLVHKLDTLGLMNASLATRGAISMAIWEIMNPSSTTGSALFPSDPAAQPYELAAANAVAGRLVDRRRFRSISHLGSQRSLNPAVWNGNYGSSPRAGQSGFDGLGDDRPGHSPAQAEKLAQG